MLNTNNLLLSRTSSLSTALIEQKMIEVAKMFGVHEVIPNDQQLLQWTVNRIVSGDKSVLKRLEAL